MGNNMVSQGGRVLVVISRCVVPDKTLMQLLEDAILIHLVTPSFLPLYLSPVVSLSLSL